MYESCHLVTLDKPFGQRFPLFIVRISILSHSPLYGVLSEKQKCPYHRYLCLEPIFVFLLLLFQMMSTWSSMSITISMDHPLASSLGVYQPYLIHTLSIKISTRFHQLPKTKLGLSISPFLVIDDNFKDSQLSVVPCVKIMDKFHQPKFVVLAPPTYVLRVWIWKLTHMHGLEVWKSNSYQMMLRCKVWTFEAWYKSELTFEHHP
jgi:hypothetical protein